ncbi:MAG: leucine-rich repeat domain-containing protein, partial [Bacteroidaceae bacterium]|nr:leucine-rich repeat domain-containing protein [Bacteroidaceae bacterium]
MRFLSFLILACMTLTASARKKVPVADELKPGTVISGIVLKAGDMTPLKSACVREMDLNDSVYSRVLTDKEGRFSFELSDTGHVLMVHATGFYGEPEYDIVAMALDKSYYEITLEPYTGQEVNPVMESRVREPHGMEHLFADVNGMRYLIDRDSKTALVSSCSTNTGTVFIPQEITYQNEVYIVNGIRSFAFYGCTGLTGLFIPEGIESIGRCSFYGCTGLDNVILPKGIKTIGEAAFSGCTGLKSVLIPETVVSMGGWAFEGCTSLSFAIIPDGVTRIEPGTFVRCSGLTSV